MRIDKTLTATERAAALVAVGLMLAIMLVVSADVVMRYLFNSPFAWAYDLIALYLMAGVFYFVLADAHRQHAHVSIDILQERMGPRLRHGADLVTALVGVTLFSLIAYIGIERTWESFNNDEVLAGTIAWPMWLSSIIVPIGSILLVLRLMLQVVVHLAGLAGRCVLPADDTARASHSEEIAQ
ncbi:TRAP transporter small permease subunit [Aromatoleum petrolei]|uniref:TRAP transporter small permease protein n=2 Tax=Aromatoleum petrolei TaxID=76116 RepID=A0ABX1MM37_9RHOO|nr:TRAP transporter small permease subunit [Aromatoleum petrolei]